MGKKTKIDWCDASWNPVTGCLHGCEYCYARRIAERFGGASETHNNDTCGCECQWCTEATGEIHDLSEHVYDVDRCQNAPYPFYFDPTFHRYRLDEPARWTKPRNIFVVSMGDLFGEWVPDEWISDVLAACEAAPQHRYLFLTKNPNRYRDIDKLLPVNRDPHTTAEMWFGHSYTGVGEYKQIGLHSVHKCFVSVEPLLHEISEQDIRTMVGCAYNDWVIIGAETGNRKNKVAPQKSWIDSISFYAKNNGVPVFMKESLRGIMGDDFRREYPWEVKDHD